MKEQKDRRIFGWILIFRLLILHSDFRLQGIFYKPVRQLATTRAHPDHEKCKKMYAPDLLHIMTIFQPNRVTQSLIDHHGLDPGHLLH